MQVIELRELHFAQDESKITNNLLYRICTHDRLEQIYAFIINNSTSVILQNQ